MGKYNVVQAKLNQKEKQLEQVQSLLVSSLKEVEKNMSQLHDQIDSNVTV